MSPLQQLEIVIALFVVVLALTTVARRLLLPYPILLVVGGLALALVPGVPVVTLHPDLVFLIFLPPILWAAAYFTSLRDFRQNLRPISLLALGLVTVTTAAVAWVVHALVPGLGWAPAVALGAIVSPPDAVAATAIARRLRVPRRVVVILEGESLVNDASALILYRAAVTAAVTGVFSLGGALASFVISAALGVAVGLLVAWVVRAALGLLDDAFSENAATLLAPYAAWVLAERLHASAVLACVAGGFYLRRHFSRTTTPATRVQALAVWDQLLFLLNGAIFILIGLQLRGLRAAVPPGEFGRLLRLGALVSLTVIVVRIIWVWPAAYLPRWLSRGVRAREPVPSKANVLLVSWTGLRGIVSLAAALALPLTTASGEPFPFRSEIVLLTFSVILATLVLQGLTLVPLIRRLCVPPDDVLEQEELRAREHAATAALARLDALLQEGWPYPEQVERLRSVYAQRLRRYSMIDGGSGEHAPEVAGAYRRLRWEAITAERSAVIGLRDDGQVSDEVLHRIEHELDVEAIRIGAGETRLSRPGVPAGPVPQAAADGAPAGRAGVA